MTIRCSHCNQPLHADLNTPTWSYVQCNHCGEHTQRDVFKAAAAFEGPELEGESNSEKPSRDWKEENARSLRSIAVSLQLLVGCALEWPVLKDVAMGSTVESLQSVEVKPFEE